jgi:hypothetical protein
MQADYGMVPMGETSVLDRPALEAPLGPSRHCCAEAPGVGQRDPRQRWVARSRAPIGAPDPRTLRRVAATGPLTDIYLPDD